MNHLCIYTFGYSLKTKSAFGTSFMDCFCAWENRRAWRSDVRRSNSATLRLKHKGLEKTNSDDFNHALITVSVGG